MIFLRELVIKKLNDRGVELEDIAQIVHDIQKNYIELTIEDCIENIMEVLNKREVQYAILTGIQIDELAEKDLLDEPLLSIIKSDEGLYGIDEVLAVSIAHIYGSIGFTNFGYLDKTKPGIIATIDSLDGTVGTFLDDIICGIAAAAAAKMAHNGNSKKADI